MKNSMEGLQKIRIELPCNLAIPPLGIYPKKMKTLILKEICNPMFIAALFTIAKIWQQTKCSLRDEWIRKLYIYIYIYVCVYIYIYIHTHTHIYIMEYYSAIKKRMICYHLPQRAWI